MDVYDIGIIGAGVAGSFATLKIAKEHKGMKAIVFDLGRPMAKRRSQLDGWLGVLPNSDGKLYLNDINTVSDLVGGRKAKATNKWFTNYISNIIDLKTVKDKSPSINVEKRIKKSGFELHLNDFIQLYPRDIHMLSRYMSQSVCDLENINLNFDDDVISIKKVKRSFIIESSSRKVECKKIIVCTGRSGWRWTKQLYDSFGIVKNNDIAKFGIRIETSTAQMKDFNKSNCSILKEGLDIGPLSWNGTVIPEDHVDLAISAFRSNEDRWKSDKVSFNLIGHRKFENNGFEQTNRIGQLTFILSNDRIIKEKISTILSKKSTISIMPEYNWLGEAVGEVSKFIPDIISKGYFHVPTIMPLVPKINVDKELCTDIDGMYCAGEASGAYGILSAILTGLIAADNCCL